MPLLQSAAAPLPSSTPGPAACPWVELPLLTKAYLLARADPAAGARGSARTLPGSRPAAAASPLSPEPGTCLFCGNPLSG